MRGYQIGVWRVGESTNRGNWAGATTSDAAEAVERGRGGATWTGQGKSTRSSSSSDGISTRRTQASKQEAGKNARTAAVCFESSGFLLVVCFLCLLACLFACLLDTHRGATPMLLFARPFSVVLRAPFASSASATVSCRCFVVSSPPAHHPAAGLLFVAANPISRPSMDPFIRSIDRSHHPLLRRRRGDACGLSSHVCVSAMIELGSAGGRAFHSTDTSSHPCNRFDHSLM